MAEPPPREVHGIRHLRKRQLTVIIIANERDHVGNSRIHTGASRDLRAKSRLRMSQDCEKELSAPGRYESRSRQNAHGSIQGKIMSGTESYWLGFARADRVRIWEFRFDDQWARTKLLYSRLLYE